MIPTGFALAALAGEPAVFPPDQFGRVDATATQGTGGPALPEAASDSGRFEPVLSLATTDRYRLLGRAVGMLDLLVKTRANLPKDERCTATLIAPTRILTNYHCVPNLDGTVTQAWLHLGFLELPLGQSGDKYPVAVTPIEANATLDYAILEVKGVPADRYPPMPLRVGQPVDNESLYILHHPLARPLRLTRMNCQAASPPVNPATGEFVHYCDTEAGSSGALILDQDFAVVALHKAGRPDEEKPYNLATPMAKIFAASAELQRIAKQPVAAQVDAPPIVEVEDYSAAAREACEAAARAAGEIEWKRRLDAAVAAEAKKAADLWASAGPKLEPCATLTAADLRARCKADVQKVVDVLRAGRATVPAGPVQASAQGVSCSAPMGEFTQAVVPKELEAAEALLAKLTAAVAQKASAQWLTDPVLGRLRPIPAGTFTMGSTNGRRMSCPHILSRCHPST